MPPVRGRGSPHCSEFGSTEISEKNVTTLAVIANEAKQSPSRKEEIASSQETLLAMTQAEQLQKNKQGHGTSHGLVTDDTKLNLAVAR
jgi:hypothetical protein